MASIKKGILGPISGLVGTVIGGTWKGINYIRSKPAASNREPSPAQLEQQARFALMMRCLQTLSSLLPISFKQMAIKMSAFNSAFSYNVRNAVTGTFPDFEVAYDMVLVSRGDLPNASDAKAALGTGTQIAFTWTDNTGTGKAAPTDKTVMVVHCPDRQHTIFDFGTTRAKGADSIALSAFAGHTVHTWLGFISADSRLVATSVYTGSFVLPA